jgi:hypothetical protein
MALAYLEAALRLGLALIIDNFLASSSSASIEGVMRTDAMLIVF